MDHIFSYDIDDFLRILFNNEQFAKLLTYLAGIPGTITTYNVVYGILKVHSFKYRCLMLNLNAVYCWQIEYKQHFRFSICNSFIDPRECSVEKKTSLNLRVYLISE